MVKKLFLCLALLLLVLFSVSAELYDSFESGSLNLSKWTVIRGDPLINSSIFFHGFNSVELDGGNGVSEDRDVLLTSDSLIGSSDVGFISFYVLWNSSNLMVNDELNFQLERAGSRCVGFALNVSGSDEWEFQNGGGWIGTNVSFSSGRGNVLNNWVQIRLLVNNSNNRFSLRIGNTSSNDLSDLPYEACLYGAAMRFDPTKSFNSMFIDRLTFWNESVDWDESTFSVMAFDVYNNSISDFNLSVGGEGYHSYGSGLVETFVINSKGEVFDLNFSKPDWFSFVQSSHNVSSNFNFTNMFQGVVSFQALERVINNYLLNFSINGSILSNSTISGNATINFLVGNQTLSFSGNGSYKPLVFELEVLPLNNLTFNISVYDSVVDVVASNYSGGLVSNVSGNVSYGSWSESFFSFNNSVALNLSGGLEYVVYLTSTPDFTVGHHTNTQTHSLVDGMRLNFSLFPDESIWFSAVDIISGVDLSVFNFTLSGGTTYSFVGADSPFFNFSLATGDYTALAEAVTYIDFSQLITIVSGALTNLSAVMTSTGSGVILLVNDIYSNPLGGSLVQVTKASDDSLVISALTDGFGEVEFSLNPSISYNLNVSRSGYESYFEPFSIIESSYVVTLDFVVVSSDVYSGLSYSFLPSETVPLVNNTAYNFSFNISSGVFLLGGCWFDLLNGSNVLVSNYSFCSGSGGFGSLEFDVGLHDLLVARVVVDVNGTNQTFSKNYNVKNFFVGDFSLKTVLDGLKNFTSVGFDGFSRFLLVLFVIVGLTVSIVGDLGFVGEPSRALLVVWLLVAAFSVTGFLTITFVPFAKDYIILIFLSLLVIASLVVDWRVGQSG